MIKVVAAAIPTCPMSFFVLLESMCLDIDMLTKNFWWGNIDDKKRHLALRAWLGCKRARYPNDEGG